MFSSWNTENELKFMRSDITTTLVIFTVAPGGDHVISLIDEISYMAPPAPLLSQYDDINPEQFCNGDNRPANCGQNCMCTHKVDIPLNAIVEIVLVDEGMHKIDLTFKRFYRYLHYFLLISHLFHCSSNRQLITSIPLARLLVQRNRYWPITWPERQEN